MIVEKSQPTPGLVAVTRLLELPQIPRNGRLGDVKAELQKLAVDSRCTPARIVYFHPADQLAHLLAGLRPTERASART